LNGLFPISNYDIRKFWKLFTEAFNAASINQIEAWGGRPYVFFGVDPYSNELLCSVPKVLQDPPKGYLPDYPDMPYPFDIFDGRAKSVVYKLDENPNWWQGSYDIPAENFLYTGNELYAMKDGSLHRCNSETTWCNFFGVDYRSRIMFLSNEQPTTPKAYNNVALQSSVIPETTYFRTEYPFIQATDLKDFDAWGNLEGIFYCTLRNDKLTPSATGLMTNALITGEKMRGTVLKIMLEFGLGKYITFKFVNLGYSKSLGHTM
jgi:hypothetical protein